MGPGKLNQDSWINEFVHLLPIFSECLAMLVAEAPYWELLNKN